MRTQTHRESENSSVYVLQPQRDGPRPSDGRASADRGKSAVGRHRAMVRVTPSSTDRQTAPTEGGQWTHFCLAVRRIMSAADDAHATLCLVHWPVNGRSEHRRQYGT